jgi:hypothetical protein
VQKPVAIGDPGGPDVHMAGRTGVVAHALDTIVPDR